MGEQGFQIGWIPYLNLRPMLCELEKLTQGGFSIKSGHPTQMNKWICDGSVAVAPCSSINLLKVNQVDMALPLGVASDGPVQSVYLGFHREHQVHYEEMVAWLPRLKKLFDDAFLEVGLDLRRVAKNVRSQISKRAGLPLIYFSSASASSQALVKIFLMLWYGANESEQTLSRVTTPISSMNFLDGKRHIEMVIGDEALCRRNEFANTLDLGQIWRDITGLPFVFAVWQSSLAQVPPGLLQLLHEAAKISSVKMRVDPAAYYPAPLPLDSASRPLDLASYWQVIQYKLTSKQLQGLLLFLNLYSAFFECSQSELIPARLAKWGGQWATPGA